MRVLFFSLFTLTSYLLSAQSVTIYHCDIPPTDSLPCLNNSFDSHYLKPVGTKKVGTRTDTLWSVDIYASLVFTNYPYDTPVEFILYRNEAWTDKQGEYHSKNVQIDSATVRKQKDWNFIWRKFTIKQEGSFWINAYINGDLIASGLVNTEKRKR